MWITEQLSDEPHGIVNGLPISSFIDGEQEQVGVLEGSQEIFYTHLPTSNSLIVASVHHTLLYATFHVSKVLNYFQTRIIGESFLIL